MIEKTLNPGWIAVDLVRAETGYCLAVNDRRVLGGKPYGKDNVLYTWHVRVERFEADVKQAIREARMPGKGT